MSVTAGYGYNTVTAFIGAFFFLAPTTLTAGQVYRLAIKATGGSGNVQLQQINVNANALLGSVPGGIEFQGSNRNNGGAWSDTNTVRPMIIPVISGIDVSTGGGGGSRAAYVG